MDPLPEITLRNQFYWTSGADGLLRLCHCITCDSLLQPAAPACHYCRSTELDVVAVSGRGVVVGFSVNHQAWVPGLEVPYVVASVALEEDPRVRVSTRIVDCPVDDVAIGTRVAVRFVQRDDVWLPYFAPTGAAADPELVVAAAPAGRHDGSVRRPVTDQRYEHLSAITGIGASRMGRRLMVDPLRLTVDACQEAVADAGLGFDEIDGVCSYPGGGNMPPGLSEGGVAALVDTLGLQPTWHTGGFELPGPGGPLVSAMQAIASGLCRHVLCFRTVWQSTYDELTRRGAGQQTTRRASGAVEHTLPMGMYSAANILALNASHYMHRYGMSRETLGWIALNARANAARDPSAIYRDPMTMDDYLSARMITTPFGLYDCDVPCDASIAVIVSAAETVGDRPSRPVWFEAAGTQITERMSWDQSTLTHEPQVLGPAAHLWSRTSLRPADVDFAELYDGFTFNCLSWLEGLGFCGLGEAKDFLAGGTRIALGGELPLNTHGGQLSHGRTHGFGLIREAVTQLRGAAGERQVRDAKVGVVSSGGLTPSSCFLLTNQR